MEEEDIYNFRRDYIEEALQMGIKMHSEMEQSESGVGLTERESMRTRKLNHRWTLGEIIGDDPLPAPKDYQYL